MFAYIWCCPVILLSVLDISAATNSSEKIADVIKNISRVNNVLQELIQNYEHLQNIYKSQEIIEVTEDVLFREKNVSNTKRNSFAVTTMYVSEEDRTSEGPSEETKEDKDETTPKATVDTHLTTTEIVLSSKKNRAQVIFIDTRQKILNKKKNRTEVRNATKKTRFSVQESGQEKSKENKPKNVLPYADYDINKFTKTPTRLLSNKRILYELRTSAGIYKNKFNKIELNIGRTTAQSTVTRKGKTKNSQGITFILGDQIYSNSSKVTNNVQFNPVSNKTLPVALNQRSNNTDIMLKMDSESDSDEESGDQENIDESKDSSDEELLAQDIARTTILGKEYGDACLKLVVRKCYKVCKAVYKAMCGTKCKDEFEDDFDKFSRTGCIQSFVPKEAVQVLTRMCTDKSNCTGISYDGSSDEDEFSIEIESKKKTKKIKEKKKTKKPKKKKKSKKKACKSALKAVCRHDHCKAELKVVFNKNYKLYCDTLFGDVARRTAQINENTHGYLTAVCQMPRPNTENVTLKTEPVTNLTEYERNLNALRARYEKACIKTSREKCKDACTYAYTKACEENKCKKKKLENFSKQCVRRCKIAFKVEGQKKGSSSSESSDSDDDDDDDSDE